MFCINMAEAKDNELTLNKKINLIDASPTHSQRHLAEQFNVKATCKLKQTQINDFFCVCFISYAGSQ